MGRTAANTTAGAKRFSFVLNKQTLRRHGLQDRVPVQQGREGYQRREVSVVGCFWGVDVVVAVVPCHDNRRVVVLKQVPGDEGARDPTVAVLEGVNLHQPVVEPRRHRQGAVDVGLGRVFGVPCQQVVQFRVDMFRWAVLVDDAVGTGGVVGQRLEGAR